ncbi:MAG: cupin domain-containing protein [bacterium]|nr:cupin domain-containing protein [bacterium]
MKAYYGNIEKETLENEYFRKVLFTDPRCQLVVMCLNPGEEIGSEVHHLDQFIRVESGVGRAILNGEEMSLEDGSALVIPEGTEHNIVNISDDHPLKLYSIYTPPEHRDGTVHKTKQEAIADAADHYEK